LTESIRNYISLINWDNVLNETDAEVGDDISGIRKLIDAVV
jgi:hypothetical protein